MTHEDATELLEDLLQACCDYENSFHNGTHRAYGARLQADYLVKRQRVIEALCAPKATPQTEL